MSVKILGQPAPSLESSYPRLSRAIWDDFPREGAANPFLASNADKQHAFLFYEDFIGFSKTTAVASNLGRYHGRHQWYTYEDNSNVVSSPATILGGVARLTTTTTDNDQCSMQAGDLTAVFGAFDNTSGNAGCQQAWYEAIFKVDQVASANIFIGMAEEGASVHDFIGDDSTIVATKDFIGFHVDESAPTTMNFVYQKASQTTQTLISAAATIAAATYYKVGWRWLPTYSGSSKTGYIYDADRVLQVYVASDRLTTFLTSTQAAAATFPAGEEMSPIFCAKNGTTTAINLDIRRVAFGQMLPTS